MPGAAIISAANDAEQMIIRTRMIFDQPVPSANGAMIAVLTKLALITGENAYGMRAQDAGDRPLPANSTATGFPRRLS